MKHKLIYLPLISSLVFAEPPLTKEPITEQKTEETTKKAVIVEEQKSEEISPEQVSIHTIEKGGTLGQISEKVYGRTRYWRILKLYNECDPAKLKIGQEVKAPDLGWLLEDSGFQKMFPDVATNMLKIRTSLIAIEDAREGSDFTKEALTQIDELGTLVGKMQKSLMAKPEGVTSIPSATLQQLITCRKHLNRIATGEKSGKMDLNALAHEHLSNAMVYSVLWAKADFK